MNADHCQWLVKGHKMPTIKERETCLCCFRYFSYYDFCERLHCRHV